MAEENLTLSKQEKEGNDEKYSLSSWSQLPADLLSLIFFHAFRGGDVGSFDAISSVCQSWNNSLGINHAKSLIRTSIFDPLLNALPPEYPCLMTLEGSLCKFYHPSHNFNMDFFELCGSCIQFSKFGWLLLRRFDENEDGFFSYFFFNPFTREKIELPPHEEGFDSMCFSAPPTYSNCCVVGITFSGNFGLIKRGEQQWNSYGPSKIGSSKILSHLVLCGDRCYAIGFENKVVVFDVKKKKIDFLGKLFPSLADAADNKSPKFLVGDGTQLFGVIVSHEEKKVSIARRNESKQLWVDITNNIGNKMFFVSKRSSILKPAPVKASSNKVYFPKILNDDSFVPYCLATRKYISFFGDYFSATPLDDHIKEWFNCTWIETMPFVVAPSSSQKIEW